MPKPSLSIALSLLACALASSAQAGRALEPADWLRFRPVYDVHVSPDGATVAYLVNRYDGKTDESIAELWSVSWTGKADTQLTHGETVSDVAFSPDGRYLSYLTAQPAGSTTQLWVRDLRTGATRALTHVEQEIASYTWSADGTHAALVMRDTAESPAAAKNPDKDAVKKPPKPIVVDAFQFKADKEGYLTQQWRSHLYLLDVASGAVTALPADPKRIDSDPAFSPDGRSLAFVGHPVGTAADVARDQVWIVGTAAGSTAQLLLTTESPNHQQLEWSPDGRLISLLVGAEPKFNAYITDRLALADARTGKLRMLATDLDRAVVGPKFMPDGKAIQFTVEDDGQQYPASVQLASGAVSRLAGPMVVHELAVAAGHTAVLVSSDRAPPEVFALEARHLRALTHHNDALFAEIALGSVEDIAFKDKSGVEVHGQLVKPPDYVAGKRYPTILWIHGGPNGQDDHSLELWRLRAAAGAAVLRDPRLRGAGHQLPRRHGPRRRIRARDPG